MVTERVAFTCEGARLIGHLHLPAGQGPFPGIVVAGPMTSVKEQVTGTYAAAMAERGYAALAVDHRHYGESEGEPRQYEYYPHKIADLRASFDFLATHPAIDKGNLRAIGVCLGAGYMAHALIGRADVGAFAVVAGYYRDVPAMRSADPEGFEARIAQGRAARQNYEQGGEVITIPAVALEGDAAMLLQSTFDYYAGRAAHPNYRNAFAVMSREHFLAFDVQSAAPHLSLPFLMLHGPNALNPAWAEAFFNAVPSTTKQRGTITSQGQTDIYDDPEIVNPAADRIAAFFRACV